MRHGLTLPNRDEAAEQLFSKTPQTTSTNPRPPGTVEDLRPVKFSGGFAPIDLNHPPR